MTPKKTSEMNQMNLLLCDRELIMLPLNNSKSWPPRWPIFC